MEQKERTTEEYVVAFIDILGASKKIRDNVNLSLNQVHDVYSESLEEHKIYLSEAPISEIKPVVRIFSDNIVLAAPTIHGVDAAFQSVLVFTAIVQQNFLGSGFLTRGGITVGSFFYDDVMIWGQALVEAYQLESNIAIYPRIVILPKLIEQLMFLEFPATRQFISKDVDDLYYVNYMNERFYGKLEDNTISFYFQALLADCDQMCSEAKDDIRILQKINWHKNYLVSKRVEWLKTERGE